MYHLQENTNEKYNAKNNSPSAIKIFLISIRPFALPASVIPVIFGTLLAITAGEASFNTINFVLTFFGMIFLHSGANVLSDIIDYKTGVDRVPTPASGGIVRGLITTREASIISTVLIISGTICGGILVVLSGIFLLYVGITGLIIGIFYNIRPIRLKHRALGDLAVFINFGTLGTLGAWITQTGKPALMPVTWSIPISMLVVAILHANNWRDIETDRSRRIKTVAGLLGNKGSYIYYLFLTSGAIVYTVAYIVLSNYILHSPHPMPLSFIVVIFTIPITTKLLKIAKNGIKNKTSSGFIMLDAKTSNMSLIFGILLNVALFIDFIVKRLS